jgi:hypothetical protein
VLDWWPRRAPAEDKSTVGITFVDVLFALVIGEILAPLRDIDEIPAAGWSHLGVAVVLTLTSWIGYHNSVNRQRYLIRFPNLPLAQFVLDILMVVTYWLCVVTIELQINGRVADARPEARVVAFSFLLYAAWDAVGLLIRRDPRYRRRPLDKDLPKRRHITWYFLAVAAALWMTVEITSPDRPGVVIAVDVLLIVVLTGFRLGKEFVTEYDPFDQQSRSATEARHGTVLESDPDKPIDGAASGRYPGVGAIQLGLNDPAETFKNEQVGPA